MFTMKNQEVFINGYLTCALWSSTLGDDQGTPMDQDYGIGDMAVKTIEAMREDCIDFLQANTARLDVYAETFGYDYAGHDFWLTRNGHGAGFWDRNLGDLGNKLSDAAHQWGECFLYIGDNGEICK